MNALEVENDDSIPLSVIDLTSRGDHASVSIMVDSEWYVASGGETLAALLDMDVADIHYAPVGVFIHPDDITHSPLELGSTGAGLIVRFLHRTHGYVRIQVAVARSRHLHDCWNLHLRLVDADVTELTRERTGSGSKAKQGESRSIDRLSVP